MAAPARIRIGSSELSNFVSRLFQAKGMSAAHADAIGEVITWADQRGTHSHGISRVPMYLRVIDDGHMDVKAVPTIDSRAGAVFIVDGHKAPGAVSMKMAVDRKSTRLNSSH